MDLLLFLFLLPIFRCIFGITVNFMTLSYIEKDQYLVDITNDFNEFSEQNDLNITLHRVSITPANTTFEVDDYAYNVKNILSKNLTTYDIFMANTIHTEYYGKYLADLKDYISSDLIEKYTKGISSKIGYFDDKIVALPLYMDVGVLYSNKKLLERYNKPVPKTWDELIDIANEIVEKEKENGNNDIIGYLPHFTENESTICSSLEFIYSFRENVQSEMPSYRSDAAQKAFYEISKIRDKVSSYEIFEASESMTYSLLLTGQPLFARFWYIPFMEDYYISQLPGHKEGLSASCVGGYNLIINNNISEDKKIASGKVIEFLLSKSNQMKHAWKNGKFSGLEEIYEDEELCTKVDCSLFRKMQLIARPTNLTNDYSEYSLKYRTIFHSFIRNNKTVEETLKRIDNISSVCFIDYRSSVGIIVVTIISLLIISIGITFILILINVLNFRLSMFNKRSWFIMLLGLCIYASYGFNLLGELTEFKCNMRVICMTFGISLFYYPILINEIIYFPENNKYSNFMRKHRVLCVITLMLINIIYVVIIFIKSPYKVVVNMPDEMNFKVCSIQDKYFYFYLALIFIINFAIFAQIMIFSFIEWNTTIIYNDIRIVTTIIYINVLIIIISVVICAIRFTNMYVYILMRIGSALLYSAINYFIIVFTRMFNRYSLSAKNVDIKIAKSHTFKSNNSFDSSKSQKFLDKVINYHYSPGSSDSLHNLEQKLPSTSSLKKDADVILYTSLIPSNQVTDIGEVNLSTIN